MLTMGSLFDGIGGWQIAAERYGIKPVWSSEIEPFCRYITSRQFPMTRQLGDITKINTDKIAVPDILCAGSPCQDLSVAGKRRGLDGKRSGLFREAIRIARALRKRGGARYFVWENVPGAFSSNHGIAGPILASGGEIVGTRCANCGTKQWLGNQEVRSGNYHIIEKGRHGLTVRRLTPLECERLQGLPEGWTQGGAEKNRLQALGNGMAQPCADFVMAGIAHYAMLAEAAGTLRQEAGV